MKRFKKLLIPLLALALLVTCVMGISAAADANGGTPVPKIVSKNVCYSSKLYVMYAIPCNTVAEGSKISVRFYSSDPADGTASAVTVTKYYVDTISAITGEAEDYYVFLSPGIAARDIASTLWATPVATDPQGNEACGEAVPYGVAEYCYERLLDDGFVNYIDNDDEDGRRAELYSSLLEYGYNAYNVLADEFTVSPDSLHYLSTNGATEEYDGELVSGEAIKITHDSQKTPVYYVFSGWKVIKLSPMGVITETTKNGSEITLTPGAGGTLLKALYTVDPAYERAEQIAKAEAQDALDRKAEWEALESAFIESKGYSAENAASLTSELKNLYTLYGSEMVTWVASLYAKGFNDLENGVWAGGFYASTGGRDAYGYGPDLQCTVQLLRFLEQSGVLDSISGDIPLWMQQQMIYFAKSLQDEESGYFYHPQWGKEFTDAHISRRGRDLGWGVSLLEFFNARPTYDTPSGKSGDGQTADEYLDSIGLNKDGTAKACVAALSQSLGGSIATQVSKVVAVASTSTEETTAYLKSHTGFINYLLTSVYPGMLTSPYGTGNNLNATYSQIASYSGKLGVYTYVPGDEAATEGATAADYSQFNGMTLKEMTIKALTDTVNPITGLYGGYNSDGSFSGFESINFTSSNGFFKVITIFNSWGAAYPEAALAAVGLISNLTNADLPSRSNACEVYNVWNAIGSLKSNSSSSEILYARMENGSLTKCEASDEGAGEMTVSEFINKTLELRGADAVRITFDKIKGYKKADGAFSHSYTGGVSSHQGCPVSPAGLNISDVDATCISSTGLVRSIFTAFGMGNYRPDFFGEADYLRFIDYLEAADPVYKLSQEKLTEDFEDDSYKNTVSGDAQIKNGKLTVFGDATIYTSKLSNVGSTLIFNADLTLTEGSYSLVFCTDEGVLLPYTLTATAEKIVLKNDLTGSYSILARGSLSTILTVEFKLGDNALITSVYSDGTLLSTESLTPEKLPNKLSKITKLEINTDASAVIDDMILAVLTPVYDSTNESGRLDFENLATGELDIEKVSTSMSFINQTSGENQSYALIISEGNNKYLRLEDNWYVSEGAQNYFEFKRQTLPCTGVVFESRLRITTSVSGAVPITVLNNSGTAIYYSAMRISDGYLYANVASSKSERTSNMVKTDVKNGEWFTVRLEYIAAESYDQTFICRLYINNTLVDYETEQCDNGYGSSSAVNRFRMASDTSWHGTVDYDNVYVTTIEDYVAPDEEEGSSAHVHSPKAGAIENYVDCTCTASGSYEIATYCDGCGVELSRVMRTIAPAHKEGEPVTENFKDYTCTQDGSYDSVVYCTGCGIEMSRTSHAIPAAHRIETTRENVVAATCSSKGSYVQITSCTVCGEVCDRQSVTVPSLPHKVSAGVCTVCGETEFVIDGAVNFDDMTAQILYTGKKFDALLATESSSGTVVRVYSPSASLASVSIVSDGDGKCLSFSKLTNDTSSNSWTDFIRDSSHGVDVLVFEARFKFSYTEIKDGGIYVRAYTGRGTASNTGKRIFSDTLSVSGSYVKYGGAVTHLALDSWGTVRLTVSSDGNSGFVRVFSVKNEGTSSITYGGKVYKVGEFVPYFTATSFENTDAWSSVNDVNAVTFMHSTGLIGTYCFDNVHIGGEPNYVTP